jgi:hypothetical protein
MLKLALSSDSVGKVYHIVNPEKVNWDHLVQRILELGYPMKQKSYASWLEQIEDISKSSSDGDLLTLLGLLESRTRFEKFPTIECSITTEALAKVDIVCPDVRSTFDLFLGLLTNDLEILTKNKVA